MQADDDQHPANANRAYASRHGHPQAEHIGFVSASWTRVPPLGTFSYRARASERDASPTFYSETLDLDTVPSQGIANLARRQSKQARRLGLYPPGPFHRRDYALAICDLGGTYAKSAGWL